MLGLEPKALHILGKGSTSNLHSSKCITFWVFTVISFVTFVSTWPFFLPRHHCLEEECREVSGIWELLMLLERLKKTEELVSKQGQCKKECSDVPGDPPKRTNLTWNSIPEGSSPGLSVEIVGDVSHKSKESPFSYVKAAADWDPTPKWGDPKGVIAPSSPVFSLRR